MTRRPRDSDRTPNRLRCLTILLFVLAVAANPAYSATRTWSATPASANWSLGANWVGGLAPVAGDDLVFPAASTVKAMTNDLVAATTFASVTFDGNGYTISGNSITLSASAILGCTTSANPKNNIVNSPIVLGGQIGLSAAIGCQVEIYGSVSGPFGISVGGGTGVVLLGGANTFTGSLLVKEGLLIVGHNQALGAGDGTSTTGTAVSPEGALELNTATIANEALVIGGTGAAGSIAGALYNSSTASWGGPITLTQDTTISAYSGALTLTGPITGAGGLTKDFTYPLILTGVSSYSGATVITDGSVFVNVLLTGSSSVTVNSGATLAGSGNVSSPLHVLSGGTLAPGQSPGILNTDSLDFSPGSTLLVELTGAIVGSEYDQLNVTGAVDLGNAVLNASLAFGPSTGTSFIIVNNDQADAVVGTFQGLAEGSTVVFNGVTFGVTYVGGDGNDVALVTAVAVPTLGPLALVLLGVLLLSAAVSFVGRQGRPDLQPGRTAQ